MPLSEPDGTTIQACRHAAWGEFLATEDGRQAQPAHLALLAEAVARDGAWTVRRLTALLRVIQTRASS